MIRLPPPFIYMAMGALAQKTNKTVVGWIITRYLEVESNGLILLEDSYGGGQNLQLKSLYLDDNTFKILYKKPFVCFFM